MYIALFYLRHFLWKTCFYDLTCIPAWDNSNIQLLYMVLPVGINRAPMAYNLNNTTIQLVVIQMLQWSVCWSVWRLFI